MIIYTLVALVALAQTASQGDPISGDLKPPDVVTTRYRAMCGSVAVEISFSNDSKTNTGAIDTFLISGKSRKDILAALTDQRQRSISAVTVLSCSSANNDTLSARVLVAYSEAASKRMGISRFRSIVIRDDVLEAQKP